MAFVKVALSLTLLAASAYAADVPYLNLTYVPGEGNVPVNLLHHAEFRQLPYHIAPCNSWLCSAWAVHPACWCRKLQWQPREGSPHLYRPHTALQHQICPANAGPPTQQVLYSGYTTYQLTKSQAQSYCNTGSPAFPVVDATIDDIHSVRPC